MDHSDLDLSALCVSPEASIRDAMVAIDTGVCEIALMVETGTRKLLGCVTDGDIRRAILRGKGIDEPLGDIVTPNPFVVTEKQSRAEVLDTMAARSILQVPVVDEHGVLVGLHLLRQMIRQRPRPNVAFILAGGRGTRLRPLTETVPKPMIQVAGRPILERLLLHLVGQGIQRIVLSVNYLSELIVGHFGDGSDWGCEISYVHESPRTPLGTAGSLSLLEPTVGEQLHPVVIMNGDLVTDCDLGALLDHHQTQGAAATVAARRHTYEVPFGVLAGDGEPDWLAAIEEKPTYSWNVSAGIAVLEPGVVRRVPAGTHVQLPEVLMECVAAGERVAIWQLESDWIDVGRPAQLDQARYGG